MGSSSMLSGLSDLPLPALGAAAIIIPAVGVTAWFFYLYSQLEYITASMLTRHVPREGSGASVIQVRGAEGRGGGRVHLGQRGRGEGRGASGIQVKRS